MLAAPPPRRPRASPRRRGAPRRGPQALTLAASMMIAAGLPPPARAEVPPDPERSERGDGDGDGDQARSAAQVELGLPDHPDAARALALADARRPREAAARLEALAAALDDPRALYHAAVLRGLAGEHAAAARLFTTFLTLRAPALSPAVRAYVVALLQAELARTAEVEVILVEGTGTPIASDRLAQAQIALRPDPARAGAGPEAAPEPVTLAPGVRTRIDAGRWEVAASHPDYQPTRIQVTAAGPEVARWEVWLERRRVHQEIRLRPKRALRGAHLRLTSGDLPPPRTIEQAVTGERTTVLLTTGPWTLEATGRGARASQPIVVRDPPELIDLELTRTRRPAGDPLQVGRRAPIVFAGVVGVTYAVGVGLLLGGVSRDTRAEARNEAAFLDAGVDLAAGDPITPGALAEVEARYPTATYHRDLRRAANLSTSGVVVAIAGAASAITVIPLVRRQRRGALIEMGVGAAFLAGGAAWMAAYARMQADLLGGDDPAARASDAAVSKLTGHRLGAGMLTGIGVGTVLAPAIILLRDRLRRR